MVVPALNVSRGNRSGAHIQDDLTAVAGTVIMLCRAIVLCNRGEGGWSRIIQKTKQKR